ncbi:hypothetical protein DMZ48_00010 [Robertkochia solimangrovi]|nr:hypothetical protein DMZ48_00010 [Robertkochia solimangrovi]
MTETYKKGIYKTYEEFLNNEPSLPLDYEIKHKKVGYGMFALGGSIPVAYLKVKNKEGKEVGSIFGFSNGKEVYINPWADVMNPNVRYYQPQFMGDFCYVEYAYVMKVNNSRSNYRREMVIDLRNKKAVELTKEWLRDLIADDSELLAEFEEENNKGQKLRLYLERYSEGLQ